ncbi:MAG: DUF1559 domain-containing protein [Planctomycetaceae bacterium]|jgi:hypothetical protein|nr:DUF1559 domain-containing protein [Planctomycetaceae bacterium]
MRKQMSYDEQFPTQETKRYVPPKSHTTRNCCLFAGGGCGCLIIVLAILAAVGFYFVKGSMGGLVVAQVNANLIQNALDFYAQEHGEFPPAYTVDENGKPLHSWRVLLLPYIAEAQKSVDKNVYETFSPDFAKEEDLAALYKEIRLDEPWDSEHNKQFASRIPVCFLNATLKEEGKTNFQMIVGAKCLSNGAGSRKTEDVISNKNPVVLFVEAAPSVNWMEPKDLKYEDLTANEIVSAKGSQAGLTCPHPFASVVLFGNAAITKRSASMYFNVKNESANVQNRENVVTIEQIRRWAVFNTDVQAKKTTDELKEDNKENAEESESEEQ